MEALTPEEKKALENLSKEQFNLDEMEKRIVHQLTDKRLINQHKQRTMKNTIIQIAASIVLVIGGYWLGRTTMNNTSEIDSKNMYALFLYENEEFEITDGEILVAEYSKWATDLAQKQKLVYAEKLNDDESYWMGEQTAQNQTSKLTGYFVFYASNFLEAKTIATSHPHTNYGGGLELRPIDKIE